MTDIGLQGDPVKLNMALATYLLGRGCGYLVNRDVPLAG